jgi:hypothetical protein
MRAGRAPAPNLGWLTKTPPLSCPFPSVIPLQVTTKP